MVKARVSMTFVDFTEDYWQKSGEIGIVPSTSIVVGLLEFAEWTGYQEADKALAYQKTRREQGTIRYTDIGVNWLFIRQTAEDLNAFMAEVFTSACQRADRWDRRNTDDVYGVWRLCGPSCGSTSYSYQYFVSAYS
ncbi:MULTISPECIES: hypothetical protein [unclassified Paenibacillus]